MCSADFVRDLIDYAHTKNIKVLLCFTPFAYDGVNQYTLKRPELQATAKNGKQTQFWGMHSWGYNLCPIKARVATLHARLCPRNVFRFLSERRRVDD